MRAAAYFVTQTRVAQLWPLRAAVDLIRRRRRLRRAARLRAIRDAAVSRYGWVTIDDLCAELRRRGICDGDTIFFQGSLTDMHTFRDGANGLLQVLRALVGNSGTLCMPAYSLGSGQQADDPFDLRTAPTYTGFVNELFRRSSGVERSLHPRHSVCAIGPLASHLTQGHDLCNLADGEGSPFDKLIAIPNAKILTIGLPIGHVSFLHWLEDIDPSRLPMVVHRPDVNIAYVRSENGVVKPVADRLRLETVAMRLDCHRVASRLSSDAVTYSEYKSIAIAVYAVEQLALELLALRDRGIIHYK